jgi:hypothetical protein
MNPSETLKGKQAEEAEKIYSAILTSLILRANKKIRGGR